MDLSGIKIEAWSFGLALLAFMLLAWHLLRRSPIRTAGGAAPVLLRAAVLASMAWAALGLADQFSDLAVFGRLSMWANLLAYALWLSFLLGLLRPVSAGAATDAMRWMAPAVGLLLLGTLLLQAAAELGLGGLNLQSRPVMLAWLALPVAGLMLVEQLFRNVDDDSFWSAKPLCLGLAGMFLFDLYLFSQTILFGGAEGDAAAVRGAVYALTVPLLWLSSARRRDWVSHLRVSRKAAFHSATLLLAGMYLLFISGVGYYVRLFGGEWGRALQVGLMAVALLLLAAIALSGSVRSKLRVFLGKHFFRYRYDYRDEWLRFTETLSAQSAPQPMEQQVIRGLAQMLESPGGSLWLRRPDDDVFRQAARWNMPAVDETEPRTSALSRFLEDNGRVVNVEECRAIPRRYPGLSLPAWLHQVERAWLIVPLRAVERTVGFVLLASPRTPVDVNWEVNDLLKTAGRQAAGFLMQMQATEALLEVRKFDAFNRMSAFVVHDLKNIVTQLSLMLKNAEKHHADPEFQQDMLLTVENTLERMRKLMLQLREGATPAGTAFGVDLSRVAARIQATARGRGRHVELDAGERLLARGDEERLERVIGHVVHNALDATDADGRVWLRVRRAGSQVCVEVGDNGHGMSPEFVREQLFRPFQSTKATGMGIGAYESFQYLKELGGSISVRSEPGQGTEVTMQLPLFDAANDAALPAHQMS